MTSDPVRAGDGPAAPTTVEVFMDYHCPYSHRVVCWLDDLEAGLVEVRYRLFALEQVNHDPEAATWRIWEQPLDYSQYRARQDRRSLAGFLATAIIEATVPDVGVLRRVRRALYAARFEDRLDISDPAVLEAAALRAGLPAGWIGEALRDDARTGPARQRIADDWAAARSPYLVFGVPTVVVGDEPPVYLRLTTSIAPAEGAALWAAFRAFRAAAPMVVELKEPERIPPA